jgi:Family of unknown function (DUF6502)
VQFTHHFKIFIKMEVGNSTANKTYAGISLDAGVAMLVPFAGILLERQLRFSDGEEMLKKAFVNACIAALRMKNQNPTVSAISVATGLQRRDVKRLINSSPDALSHKPSAVERCRLMWATDKNYLDGNGRPRSIPRTETPGQYSFATLAAAISKDIPPRALLDELVRNGAVEVANDVVTLVHVEYQPPKDQDALFKQASLNIGDHLAAVLNNIVGKEQPLLERSIFADGLTLAGARHGAELARTTWANALPTLASKLQLLVDIDEGNPNNSCRVRIGMYAYYEDQNHEVGLHETQED